MATFRVPEDQICEEMAAPSERPSTVYEDELEMLNGRNGDGSPQGQLIPILPSSVEEHGGSELVPAGEDVFPAVLAQPI